MKNKLSIISAILVLVLSATFLFACAQKDDAPVAVDYKQDNSFAVNTIEDDSALVFEPIADLVYGENGKSYKKVDYRYGVVFYTGLNINASEYSYLGNALAKQGYLVIIKKRQNLVLQLYRNRRSFQQISDRQIFYRRSFLRRRSNGYSQGKRKRTTNRRCAFILSRKQTTQSF